jgi:hypothetical protein
MEITKKDLLFVYDILLHRKLQRSQCDLLCSAISLKDRPFWLYQRNAKTQQIMDEHVKSN